MYVVRKRRRQGGEAEIIMYRNNKNWLSLCWHSISMKNISMGPQRAHAEENETEMKSGVNIETVCL